MGSAVLIPVAAIAGGVVLVVMLIWHQLRMREMAMREWISMIEHGLVPSPEADPARFEALRGRPARKPTFSESVNERASRYRTSGILCVGFGVGLMLIIAFAAREPRTAFGVGGAFVVLGLALALNSLFVTPSRSEIVPPPVPVPPPLVPPSAEEESHPGGKAL